ncbi:hypothetical protein ACN27G_09385 [Plantactinospora sp. WMMB334]|uniref:hypothetical protein n=1 Tax=Plantactinospora sp. WMMB334 TaxID=3404119 RepID=UPI003B927AD2
MRAGDSAAGLVRRLTRMTSMTAVGRVQCRRSLAVIRMVAMLVGLVGLIFMHQLVGAPVADGHHLSPAAVEEMAGSELQATGPEGASALLAGPDPHCPPGDLHCPEAPHGHPGQVCPVTASSQLPAAPAPALLPVPGPVPALAVVLSPRTAAHEAAGGSGCGPPTLSELSLWRV